MDTARLDPDEWNRACVIGFHSRDQSPMAYVIAKMNDCEAK